MNPLEAAAFVLGFANLVLLIRRSAWNFPVAMAMVTCIGFVLFQAKLYAETGLQAFFFVVNAWGWWLWTRAQGAGAGVAVRWMSWSARLSWLLMAAGLSIALGLGLARWTDGALPMVDSAVAGTSVVAQLLLNLRRVENWALWIFIDIVSIGLYVSRELHLLALLYAGFLVLAVIGLRVWARAARNGARVA